jgi:hypothetical protein
VLPTFLLAAALALGTPPAARAGHLADGPGDRVHHGRKRELEVRLPRDTGRVTIDGRLDEPVWQRAALLTGFSQFFPADGVAAGDSTEVLVWYSATHLHVGIRAFAPAGTVRATLADRDRITQDDNVQLFLGTYGDSRQAMVFGVNPLGIQSDGVIIETGAQQGGGLFGGTPKAREATDLAPDYVWRSKGRETAEGYEVELEIPFKSLRYRAGSEQAWQLNVIRTVQATGHEETWAPAMRASASFLAQSGRLTGLRDLSRGLTVDLIPTVTSNTIGGPVAGDGAWRYSTGRPDVGGSARWGITSNLTLAGTANPDFSQVEADATQFTYDPRVAVFFPERRPFFLESQEQFAVKNNLVYTRRIVQPQAAAKLTGKAGGFDIGLLTAVDTRDATGETPVFNILRLQRDLGSKSRLGLLYTDRLAGGDWNRVGGVDARLVRGIASLQAQLAMSATRAGGVTTTAPLWDVTANVNGNRFGANYRASGIDERFDAQAGFIARPGIANLSATHRFTFFGAKGALLEAFTPEIYVLGRWRYAEFSQGQGSQDEQLHLRTNWRFRGGWQVGAQLLLERFGYARELYTDYRLLAPRAGGGIDTLAYTGTAKLPNVDGVMSIASPEFTRFSFTSFVVYGRDENFPEWSSARIFTMTNSLNLRPTDQLRLGLTLTREQFDRWSDGSRVLTRTVPRLRLEYQVTRQVFVRLIGEVATVEQDALRDDSRTGLPVYIRQRDGSLVRAEGWRRSRARTDFLFSYLPTPGTVVFLGWGNQMRADRPEGPSGLTATRDVFFLKVSYLFRLQ